MREQREVSWTIQLIGRLVTSILEGIAGAIINSIVATLTPPLQKLETEILFWLVQNHVEDLNQLSWGWICLYISVLLACMLTVIAFLFISFRYNLSSARKRPYFPPDWGPNPWSWRNRP